MKPRLTEIRAKVPWISLKLRLRWVSACVFSFWCAIRPGHFILFPGLIHCLAVSSWCKTSYNSDIPQRRFMESLFFCSSLHGGFSGVWYCGWAHSLAFLFQWDFNLVPIHLLTHLPSLKRKPVKNEYLWGPHFDQFCWKWLAFKLYQNRPLM